MDRRSFLKWLTAFFAILLGAGAGTVLSGLRRKSGLSDRDSAVVQAEEAEELPVGEDLQLPDDPQAGKALATFAIMSDIHASPDDPLTLEHFKSALSDMTAMKQPVDVLLLTGDCTDYGRERDYKELGRLMKAYKLPPVHANMGNHEYYDLWLDKTGGFNREGMPNGKTDAMARERFLTFFGYKQPYNRMDLKGCTILLLSQEGYMQEKPEAGEGAWYTDAQMEWFKAQLASLDKTARIFIMIHQPLPMQGRSGGSHQIVRGKEIRELIAPYKNVFVFCGHRHQDFQNGSAHYLQEPFHYFHNSSVGRTLNKTLPDARKSKTQGLYVQVFENKVVVRGREYAQRRWLKEAHWTIALNKKSV